MKLIGVVDWTNRDKNGVPIAGVIPLVEKQKGEWRIVDATDEFPSQGQVFWFAAHGAVENALVQFRAKQNPGQKDEYQVDAPELIWEVLDLRRYGSPADVRAALVGALPRIHGPVGAVRALVLCASDVLVGPVDLTRAYDNTVKLSGSSHPRVPLYSRSSIRPLSINDREQRLIRVDESAPSGYVDWDDDATVLKRVHGVAILHTRDYLLAAVVFAVAILSGLIGWQWWLMALPILYYFAISLGIFKIDPRTFVSIIGRQKQVAAVDPGESQGVDSEKGRESP